MAEAVPHSSASTATDWFRLSQDVRLRGLAAFSATRLSTIFENALLTLLSTQADEIKYNVLVLIQENASFLFRDRKRHLLKGQLLVTTTAIMIELSLIERDRGFFERVVTVLYSVISNVNGALDRYSRQMACECLRELETAYPCLLETYVSDLLPECRPPHSAPPSLPLFACCEAERSHVAQSYVVAAITALEHAATRLTQEEHACSLADALARAGAGRADTGADPPQGGDPDGARPGPKDSADSIDATGRSGGLGGRGGEPSAGPLGPQAEGEPSGLASAGPQSRPSGTVPAPVPVPGDEAGRELRGDRARLRGMDGAPPDGSPARVARPAAEGAPAPKESDGYPEPGAQAEEPARVPLPFDVRTPCHADAFRLPPLNSLPIPGPVYQSQWPQVMWRCDRVEAWRLAATTRGTALPPESIDRVTRALSMVLDSTALLGTWGRLSVLAKAVPFAHTAGVPDPVFRHHLFRLAHQDSPAALHAIVLVHAALMSALSFADEAELVARVAATARDPALPVPLRLLALHWMRGFPAKAAREAVGQSSPFALLHASAASLLPRASDPLPVRLASLAALLDAYHPDPRAPCAPPPSFLRCLDCLRELRYHDAASPTATAAFALLHAALLRFPQLCHGARAWLHDLVANAPRFAGHAVHLVNLLHAAEPPPTSALDPARKAAALRVAAQQSGARRGADRGGSSADADADAGSDSDSDSDGELGAEALPPLTPTVFGTSVTRAVALYLLTSFLPLLVSLRPRERLVPLLPLARRIAASRDLDPTRLLEALAELAAEPDVALAADWMLGQRLLDVARTAMLVHPVPLVWRPVLVLLDALASGHGDVDVRDRADHYRLLLTHVGGARLARVLRGDAFKPAHLRPELGARGEGVPLGRAPEGQHQGSRPLSAGGGEAPFAGDPAGVSLLGEAGADPRSPVAEMSLRRLLLLRPIRAPRRRLGVPDGASADLLTSRRATLRRRRLEAGFGDEQRPRASAAACAAPPPAAGLGWPLSRWGAPSDAGADGATTAEAVAILAEDVEDCAAARAAVAPAPGAGRGPPPPGSEQWAAFLGCLLLPETAAAALGRDSARTSSGESPSPSAVRELLLAGAAAATVAPCLPPDGDGTGGRPSGMGGGADDAAAAACPISDVLWALYAVAVAGGAAPNAVHLPLRIAFRESAASAAAPVAIGAAAETAAAAAPEGAAQGRAGARTPLAAGAATPSSAGAATPRGEGGGMYALTLVTSLSPDMHPVRPVCLPYLAPAPPQAPAPVRRSFPHAYELLLAVHPRAPVPTTLGTRCVFSDARGTARAGHLGELRITFSDLLQPLPAYILGAAAVRAARRALLVSQAKSSAQGPPPPGACAAAWAAGTGTGEADLRSASPLPSATACAQSLLFDALWRRVVEDGESQVRPWECAQGVSQALGALRAAAPAAAEWVRLGTAEEALRRAAPHGGGGGLALPRGGCESVRLLRLPRDKVLQLLRARLGPFLVADRRTVAAALRQALGAGEGGGGGGGGGGAAEGAAAEDAEELWYQDHLDASAAELDGATGAEAPGSGSAATRKPAGAEGGAAEGQGPGAGATPHYDVAEARLAEERARSGDGRGPATAAEREAIGLPKHARMLGGRLVSRSQIVRVGVYAPPGYHLLLRFCISESSTLVRIRTDRWQLIAEVDRFLRSDAV